jgi:cytolysin-activating lysine-acyltransferase
MKKPDKAAGKARPARSAAGSSTAPATGAAALQEALVGFAASPIPAAGAQAAPKTVAQVLGEIAWLMTQSPRHKAMTLGDLEWLVMPAILLRQFRIFYQGDRPVGVALWALADDLVAKRIDAGDNRLAAVEWKSGALLRVVDIIAPFGGEAEMRAQLA